MQSNSLIHPAHCATFAGALFILWMLAFFFAGAPVFKDPDSQWHLMLGQWMLDHRSVPQADPWSFSAPGHGWFILSWLFDGTIALLHKLGGFTLLHLFTLFTVCAAGFIMARSALEQDADITAVLLVGFFALWVVYSGTLLRPQIASYVLAAGFYILLKRAGPLLWLLPVLMALWANLHGGFLLGFALLACHMVPAFLRGDHRHLRRLLLLALACLIASLMNPYGVEIYTGAHKSLDSALRPLIGEWQPLRFGMEYPAASALVFFIMLLGRPFSRSLPLADRLLSLLLLIATLHSVRYSHYLALLTLPYLSACLSQVLREGFFAAPYGRKETEYRADFSTPRARYIVTTLAAASVLLITLAPLRPAIGLQPAGFDKTLDVADVLEYVQMHHAGVHFLNHYNLGGPLIYQSGGSFRVFIDGRADTAYPAWALNDYVAFFRFATFGEEADNITARYNLGGLILPRDSGDAKAAAQNPKWRRAFDGENAVVFVRK